MPAIACARARTHNIFLTHNFLRLIKRGAYSHVTIKQATGVNYYTEVTFISILVLEVIDST